MMRLRRSAFALSVALAMLTGAPPEAAAGRRAKKARVLPAWDVTGDHDLRFDPGYASLIGHYEFAFEGRTGTLDIGYMPDASRIQVGGSTDDFTFLSFGGTWSAAGGVQTVRFQDAAKRPKFTFTGALAADLRDVEGTYHRAPGFLGMEGTVDAPFVLDRRTPPDIPATFRLRMKPTMNGKGVVRGALDAELKETLATLDAYGGRVFTKGKIRGKVVTKELGGPTTAKLRIAGPGWTAVLQGPVDADGFHALADIRASGFTTDDAAITIPVVAGPEPPPPPPPPPPKYLLAKATARIVSGQVSIVRKGAPSKFFGKSGDVHVEFPSSDALQTIHATPATSGGTNPRRFYVTFGTKSYGTATAPADVTMEIRSFSTIPGQVIEVFCSGLISNASGATKPVDLKGDATDGILVQATVVQ